MGWKIWRMLSPEFQPLHDDFPQPFLQVGRAVLVESGETGRANGPGEEGEGRGRGLGREERGKGKFLRGTSN